MTSAASSLTDHTGSLVFDFKHSGRKHYNINGGCVWSESTPHSTVSPPVVMVVCSPNVLPSKRGFHPGRRGNSSQLFTSFPSSYKGKQSISPMYLDLGAAFVVLYMLVYQWMQCVYLCVLQLPCELMYLQTFHSVGLWDHTAWRRQTGFLWVWQ